MLWVDETVRVHGKLRESVREGTRDARALRRVGREARRQPRAAGYRERAEDLTRLRGVAPAR